MSSIECIKGKFGKDCKDNCPSNCNNDVCNFDNGDCIDRCKPGYQGNKCKEKCTIGTFGESCGNNCSGNCEGGDILCRHTDGHCLNGCQTGWNGTNCFSACDEGFHGRNCEEKCSEHCATGNRNCNANTGYCEMGCQPGWTGQRCVNACPSGKFGAECKENCASTCKYDVCDHVNGSCHGGCKPGYQGKCDPGTFGENCQEKCSSTCKNGVCGHLYGGCSNGCTPGYHGKKCEEISDNILCVTKPYSGCNETRKLTIALICVGILCACVIVYATVITILFKRKTIHDAKDGSNVSCSGRSCDDATANKIETVTAEAATEAATELARVDINAIDDESHHYTDLTPDTKGVEATYETIQLE
ncbi:platelet endothelial aggregation receptor 1-like isoform X3 [Ruditapes philippinarum]|uniref:platelet endothelial aggregation receptor 1-like isoform X3 n=1 Tax=Ruditapes philippinarum TaxID=129788 RepID=UPI00295BFC8A|nr:platelet endothelial aggregation receptor 1-like isoform X3 [Ruditapes philippinarum]